MSVKDHFARTAIIKANSNIRTIQRALKVRFVGQLVRINCDKRGATTGRRYKTGTEFIIYDLLVEGHDVTVWLSRVNSDEIPRYELAVWLHEVEFLPKVKA